MEVYTAFLEKRKEYQEKLSKSQDKDKVDFKEFEEFFQVDENEKHFQEMSKQNMKDLEFFEKQAEIIEKNCTEEDVKMMLKDDVTENEILKNYQKWEGLLKEQTDQYEKVMMDNIKEMDNKIKNGKQNLLNLDFYKMEGKEDEKQQNKIKFVNKEKRRRTASLKASGSTDVFWNKKNNPKSNKQEDLDE